MSDKSRISKQIPLFNNYINTTDIHLQQNDPVSGNPNWQRLGLSVTEANEWQSKRLFWKDTLYPKYSDPLQSTSAVKAQVQNFITDFRTFAMPLLNIIASNKNANTADEAIYNFKTGRKKPTRHNTAIADAVVFDAKPLGGGEFKFSCRTGHDNNRASKATGADSVQLSFMIVDAVSNVAALHAESTGMQREIFTKAQFIKNCDADNVCKRLVVFARWYNTKHPLLAGPWSAVKVMVIA